MKTYINIVILYKSHFHKGSTTNNLHTYTLWTTTTFGMGLPGYKGQGQGVTKIKTKYFIIQMLSYTNSVTMYFVRLQETFMATQLNFIF